MESAFTVSLKVAAMVNVYLDGIKNMYFVPFLCNFCLKYV